MIGQEDTLGNLTRIYYAKKSKESFNRQTIKKCRIKK